VNLRDFLNTYLMLAIGQWRSDTGVHHVDVLEPPSVSGQLSVDEIAHRLAAKHHVDPGNPDQRTVDQIGRKRAKDGPGWSLSLDGKYYVGNLVVRFPPAVEPAPSFVMLKLPDSQMNLPVLASHPDPFDPAAVKLTPSPWILEKEAQDAKLLSEWDCPADCPGCMCPSGNPPCAHCVDHYVDPDAEQPIFTPFNKDGYLDNERLAAMGFQLIGKISEDSEIERKP
jgi:hypothetical protein